MIRWILVALGALVLTPSIGHAASPMDPIYACAAVVADPDRLKCFDDALAKLRAAEQTGDVTIVDRAGVQTLEKDGFGFHLPSLSALFARKSPTPAANTQSGVDQVSAKVERTTRGVDGSVFVLDNGQTWRQVDTSGAILIRQGDAVTVKHAALGSFMLSRASGGAGIRVKRVE